MNLQQPQAPQISKEQVMQSCSAGLQLLSLETTLVPGTLRRQLAVLEAVLQGIATGNLHVVSPMPQQVESGTSEGEKKPVDDASDLTGEDDDARTTDATAT